ncbi:TetR/AcrR family transcriptional regulator [Lolliginicoccus levis]|uniref:TetR/AcrR family transcriptional regulator n=1 Tax=Lolliginicoccus levis TaxID=2919542 RepID=UPI0024200B99|nr:TetR family transcriptional regulator [Lolliginicoccus levis]
MTSTSARTQRQRSAEMRARLIDATIDCLRQGGYGYATTRNIAANAEVSLGALAHQFPGRIALIAAAIDEVGRRCVDELARLVQSIPAEDPGRPGELLDAAWAIFDSDLFVVWIKVWTAAAENEELYAALAPVERKLSRAIAATVDQLIPVGMPVDRWKARSSVVLAALRGVAFANALEPRDSTTADRWPIIRAELLVLVQSP